MLKLRLYFLLLLPMLTLMLGSLGTVNDTESLQTLLETKTNISVGTKTKPITPAAIAAFEESAIVIVRVVCPTGIAIGNGFVFGDGTLVATAWHLIADVSEIGDHIMLCKPTVISRYFGDIYEAKIVVMDPDMDLAILELPWSKHPALELATEQELLDADEAIIAAYPGVKEAKAQDTPHICLERLPIDMVGVRRGKSCVILLGAAKKVSGGWSGAPIILPENGKVAGLFSTLFAKRWRHRGQQPWGCSANMISSLVGKVEGIQSTHSGKRLQGILKVDSEAAFVAAVRSVRALSQRNLKDANSKTQEFVKLRPDSPRAHTLFAAAAALAGNNNLAEEQYQKALRLAPDSTAVHYWFGVFLEAVGRKEEAIARYRRALEIEPNRSSVLINLVRLLREFGKVKEAEALGRRGVEVEPRNAYLWKFLGYVLEDRGKTDEAIQALYNAVSLKPERGPLRGNLAHLLEKTGRFDEAESHYKKLLEIEPANPVVWFWFAKFISMHRREKRNDALGAIDKAISLNDPERVPLDELRRLRSQLQEPEK